MQAPKTTGLPVSDSKIIAAAIKSRKAWQTITEHLDSSELGADTAELLSLVSNYYSMDASTPNVDVEILSSIIGREITAPKHISRLQTVIQNLPETSPANIANEILEIKRHRIGLSLSGALLHGSPDLKSLLSKYNELSEASDLAGTDDDEIIENFKVPDLVRGPFNSGQLVPILPRALNERLDGGAKPGHHLLVFAPTEMGKTLLVINMLAGWVKAKLRVLYVGNEDPVEDLMMRYISRLTLMKKQEILAHPDAAQELLEKRGYENVIFAPLAPGNFATINRLASRFTPKVIVLDQLRNIDVDSEHRTQALEKAAQEARNLAKRHNAVVVSVSQAADSATGKRILSRGDVDGSNIGIPGATDVMIGLGGTEEDEKSNVRTLSFPKNKLSGNHDSITISIDPQLSMVLENR